MQRSAGKLWPFNERLERRHWPHRWRPGTTATTTSTTITTTAANGQPGPGIAGEPFGNKFELPL